MTIPGFHPNFMVRNVSVLPEGMTGPTRNIKLFLFSQHLADGLRITLAIALPALLSGWLGVFEKGILVSLGALCVSICDVPGPVKHRRNGMFYCNLFLFVMSVLTGLVNDHAVLLGLLIIGSSFFFSMLSIYGNRSASVGTAALLVLVLRMTTLTGTRDLFGQSWLILLGGTWYMLLALVLNFLNPYRPAQRSLAECIRETARYLRIRASLLTQEHPPADYKKLVDQQAVVHEKQEQVRELLFKNRALLRESISSGRLLVLAFSDVVDLFEQVLAAWPDSGAGDLAISESAGRELAATAMGIANKLDDIAYAIQSRSLYREAPVTDFLKDALQDAEENAGQDGMKNGEPEPVTPRLEKIRLNLRNLDSLADQLGHYFAAQGRGAARRPLPEYRRFVHSHPVDPGLFRDNLTLQSTACTHALRVAITCLAGFMISRLFPGGHHSYWILLTIIVILKPSYSLTRQRNRERLVGTLAGGAIGVAFLLLVHDRQVLALTLVLCMIGTYTFQRVNYVLMVIFMTPYLLILFSILGSNVVDVAEERVLDTLVGSGLSLLAIYFLFPRWESPNLLDYMAAALKANFHYFNRLGWALEGRTESSTDYKLARKEVFLSLANLSGAFNRMLSEPAAKQQHRTGIYEFVALNNLLSTNIAGLVASVRARAHPPVSRELYRLFRRAAGDLQAAIRALDDHFTVAGNPEPAWSREESPDAQLLEQLEFVCQLAGKIRRDIASLSREPMPGGAHQ